MKNIIPRVLILLVLTFTFFVCGINAYAINPKDVREPQPPLITEDGVLFTFKDEKISPKYVQVIGDFNNWEQPLYMTKNRYDVHVYLYNTRKQKGIVLDEGRYRYRFLVDGIWIRDPSNDKTEYDQYGTTLSYFDLNAPLIIVKNNPVQVKNNTYIFYYKNDRAREVYLVGDFNNWNPYSLPMNKNISGLWEMEVDILPGSYAYILVVDGVYRKDPLGSTVVFDRFENEFSSIRIR
ncbi:MAG: glycogen-binding domain-containing protein [Spirochaetota bacterium]|nr:MAG: glycogen-binding domain-containing protein [Spirochaetota bacterium]